MTAREMAEALVCAIRGKMFSEQVKVAEAALTTAYEEGATELIVNAQVEYARGQADERARCEKLATDVRLRFKAAEALFNNDGDRGAMAAAGEIILAIRGGIL